MPVEGPAMQVVPGRARRARVYETRPKEKRSVPDNPGDDGRRRDD